MRIYLTIFLSFLLVPFSVFAAKTDVTMNGTDAVIGVGGYSLVVSGSVNFDSITVNASNFTIDLSKGANLTVTSADKRKFTVSPTQYQESFSCGSSESTMTVANNLWDSTVTVTVTPSSDACSIGGGGISGGGGGGSVPTPVYTVVPGTQVSAAVPSVVSAAPTAVSVSAVFTTTMKVGMTSADVKRLQQILNSDSDTQIAVSGVGSPGNETEYFGNLTSEAVKKFQKKYGIVSSGTAETTGYGLVGPGTRAKLQEVFGGGVEPAAPKAAESSSVAVGVSLVFTRGLEIGKIGEDVKRLQQLLNSDPDTRIAVSGIGSPGNETEYFGSLTEKAVQKFQLKYGVLSAGDKSLGLAGPLTRKKLQEIFGD